MRNILIAVFFVISFACTASAEPAIPSRVNAELSALENPKVMGAIGSSRLKDGLSCLVEDLVPVSEGKFSNLDPTHRKFVARIRILRLILAKDEWIGGEFSKSRYRDKLPDDRVKSFWVWMSRDIYFFPTKQDQIKLIQKWKDDVATFHGKEVNWDLDINEWWF